MSNCVKCGHSYSPARKELGYKTCLVSPELPLKKIANINKFEKKYHKYLDYIDAVCTKKINFWNKYEN